MSRLSFDTIQAIHRLAREGKSAREIAAALGVSFASVRLHACGLLQSRGRPRLTASEVQERWATLFDLRSQGLSLRAIGKQLNLSLQRVSKILKMARQKDGT